MTDKPPPATYVCSRCGDETPASKRPLLTPYKRPLCSLCQKRTGWEQGKRRQVRNG